MNIDAKLKTLLDETLRLDGATAAWPKERRLLGSLPELDSLAVTEVITAIEHTFAISIHDDEIDADVFATLGSLEMFVSQKLAEKP